MKRGEEAAIGVSENGQRRDYLNRKEGNGAQHSIHT